MPNAYVLKSFDGGAEQTTLSAAMSNTANSFSVVDGSSYPSGANPFVVVIDRGLATEEKLLISGRIANSFTVLERAYDGSSAQNHALGAVVEHCLDAFTIEQANRYVNLQTTKGDLVVRTASNTDRLAVGTNDLVLVADSTAASGVRWGTVTENALSEEAIDAIATVVLSQVAPSGVPAGIVVPYAGSSAPAAWLLCEGQTVSAATYPTLFAAIGYTYGGSGSTFSLPNLKGRVPVGKDSTQTEFDVLNDQGGAKTHSLIIAELASHTHTGTTVANGAHSHTVKDFPIDTKILAAGTDSYYRSGVNAQTSTEPNHTHTFTSNSTGSGSPHNNLQPYITLNYIIKT